MKLADFARGRDNNFNLIRMLAAFAVLVSHSFSLVSGSMAAQPLINDIGMTPASMAVDIFFITSGFLVTSSLLTRENAVDYVVARVLRIFPALLVMLLLTVFVLGVFFTTLPLPDYFSRADVYAYLLKNATLVTGLRFSLPGVFESNPWAHSVNGPLWTLPYELTMYALLLVLWLFARTLFGNAIKPFVIIIAGGVSLALAAYFVLLFGYSYHQQFLHLSCFFFAGAAFYVLRMSIVLSWPVFLLLIGALVVSAGHLQVFNVLYPLSVAYVVFFVAYVPAGLLRHYNRLGDYSYGVYIYAFPVQQSLVALLPGISVFSLITCSAMITLFLAVLSWHLLEKHVLSLKGECAARLQGFL